MLLYQLDLRQEPLEGLYEQHAKDTGEPIPQYTREAVDGVESQIASLDERIDGATHGWSVDRLGVVERAILRLALWELSERPDVPAEVAIDAADVYLRDQSIGGIADTVAGAVATLATIRRSLRLSLAYNIVAGTLAVVGVIHPLIAALLMPASSLTVLANSLRSRAFKGTTS